MSEQTLRGGELNAAVTSPVLIQHVHAPQIVPDTPMSVSQRNGEQPVAPPTSEEARARSPMLEISTAMVRLYKEAFGRGPTKARTHFAGPDCLVVLLEDSMTVSERTLAALGEHGRLRESRLFFQHALETEFRAIVERTLQRRTLAFISGIDTARDVSLEFFTLEPQPDARAQPDARERLKPDG